jgi:hypothetical protein
MALRRPNRSIEVFDISLMNVVTKAMGAFLVLMLLLYPHHQRMRQAQRKVEQAAAKSQQLKEKIEELKRDNEAVQVGVAPTPSDLEKLRRNVAELEQENRRLTESARAAGQASVGEGSFLIFFNWADCDADRVDSYVRGEGVRFADGSEWEPVRKGPQATPPLAVRFDGEAAANNVLRALGANKLSDLNFAESFELSRRTSRLTVWAINGVKRNVKYAIYAKLGTLRGSSPCKIILSGLSSFREEAWPLSITRDIGGVRVEKSGQVYRISEVTYTDRLLFEHRFAGEEVQ